ncbi:MAG: hypothetical protein K2J29_02005 [Muribaculaceae bacterium]|nr:hypothetical protein [Muribaculaceae bacterium]
MENNTIRVATRGILVEMRDMKVGDTVRFPIDKYNYNSIRAMPGTSLVPDRMKGKKWKTKINYEDKCIDVIRVS